MTWLGGGLTALLLAIATIELAAFLHWFYMEYTASTRSRRWRRNAT